MKLEEIHRIAVLGAGIMGHGIAQSFLMAGYPVILYDIQDAILETAKAHIEEVLSVYGHYDAYTLERMVHREAPWINARGGLPIDEPSRAVISIDDMRKFYKKLANE